MTDQIEGEDTTQIVLAEGANGPVTPDADPILAERGLPPIDFLKVAHHGSATATTGAFWSETDNVWTSGRLA